MNIVKNLKMSCRALSHPSALAVCGMLLALRVVLGYFSNFSLAVLPTVKFGFDFLPIAIAAALYGPVAGGIVGGLGDIISFILNPMGMYFPGWTLIGIIVGMIYGFALFNREKNLVLLIISRIIIAVIEILLGTLWLYIQLGLPVFPTLLARGLTQLIRLPIEITIIYFIVNGLIKILKYEKLLK